MLSFHEVRAAQTYQPASPADCDLGQFTKRMGVCRGCAHRRNNQCTVAGQIVSVLGRRKQSFCPIGKWPGGLKQRAPAVKPGNSPSDLDPIAKPAPSVIGTAVPEVRTSVSVAFLTPTLGAGGAERVIISLARHLPGMMCGNLPITVSGIVSTGQAFQADALHPEAERWVPVRVLGVEREASLEILRDADFIVAWGFNSLEPLVPADRRGQIIYVAHGTGEWTAKLNQQASPLVDHWAGVSQPCLATLPAGCPPMTVIHNGADVDRCSPVRGRRDMRARWGVKPGQIVVGYIGRLSPEKRPEAIAEAIMALPDKYLGVIAGSGWQDEETRAMVQRIAGDRVRFLGHQTVIGDVLAALDVWINASPAEGFSLSLIEAWLAGLPCVSTPTGAIEELEQQFGQLVQRIPIGASGRDMVEPIRDAVGASRTMAERARRIAWERFTAPAMAARWADYLSGLAGK